MRDRQLAAYLETWNGFRRGVISSSKPNEQVNLSEILQSSASERYYFSAKACAGILRRAEKRGKELPPTLREALAYVAVTGAKIIEDVTPRGNVDQTIKAVTGHSVRMGNSLLKVHSTPQPSPHLSPQDAPRAVASGQTSTATEGS